MTLDKNWLAADLILGVSGGYPKATAEELGCIKVGSGLSITADGVLSSSGGGYTLPTATDSVLGGVKIGADFSITSGVISARPIAVPVVDVTGGNIALTYRANTYVKTVTANTTFAIVTGGITLLSDTFYRFELILTMGATAYTVTFPNTVTWIEGSAPSITSTNHQWRLVFETQDGGSTWLASCNADYDYTEAE